MCEELAFGYFSIILWGVNFVWLLRNCLMVYSLFALQSVGKSLPRKTNLFIIDI